MITLEDVIRAIEPVLDPDVGLSIVGLGLVYGAEIMDDGKSVKVLMTLTSPACPAAPMILSQTKTAVEALEGVEEVTIDLVWEPPWDPRTMATDDVKDILGIWD